jgi:hypothetical protein
MKPENKPVKINLIGQPKELLEKIFSEWAINFGRIIIVLTELVALSALGYRFFIDRQIIDLHDRIKTKEAIISNEANKEKENEFRDIQARLGAIKTYAITTDTASTVLQEVFTKTNSTNFTIEQIAYSKETITVSGSAFSVFALNDFVNSMKSHELVKTIALNNVESSENAIEFAVSIQIQ